jgi:diphthamide synthase (EF-2-diphthine--ammonia ligase)
MIVSCNTMMGEQYLGKILTKELAQELQEKDPCGENGEFHTLYLTVRCFLERLNCQHSLKFYENYCFIVWEE